MEQVDQGRTFIVTGAGGGIGEAVSRRLLRDGCHVVAVDFSASRLSALEGEGHEGLVTVRADVTSAADVAHVVEMAIERSGQVHGIANIAGGMVGISQNLIDTPLQEITREGFQQMLALNLESAFMFIQALELHFESHAYGKVVNISSLGAFGNKREMGNIPYNAAKAGIIGMSTTMSMLLGVKGIRVNVVAPGLTLSDRVKGGFAEDFIQRHREMSPLHSTSTPDDIAAAVCYFLAAESDRVTGEVLRVAAGVR